MSDPDMFDEDNSTGASSGSLVTTLLRHLERKQDGPTPHESEMLAELVLAMARQIDNAPMDEVIAVLSMLPGLSETTRAKLDHQAA